MFYQSHVNESHGSFFLVIASIFLRVCTVNRLCSLNFEIYSVVN